MTGHSCLVCLSTEQNVYALTESQETSKLYWLLIPVSMATEELFPHKGNHVLSRLIYINSGSVDHIEVKEHFAFVCVNLSHFKGQPCYRGAIQQNAQWVVAPIWVALWEICRKATWCNPDKCGCNGDRIEIVAGEVRGSPRKSLTVLSFSINWSTEGFLFVHHDINLRCLCCVFPLPPLLSTIFLVII